MREDKLGDLSMELSVEILQLTKELRAKHENVISNQIGRSATSICANIAESKYAHGRADFIAKLEISLKETNETSRGLKCFGNVIILTKKDIEHSTASAQQ